MKATTSTDNTLFLIIGNTVVYVCNSHTFKVNPIMSKVVGEHFCSSPQIPRGVPQGSVLVPALFSLTTPPFVKIFREYYFS